MLEHKRRSKLWVTMNVHQEIVASLDLKQGAVEVKRTLSRQMWKDVLWMWPFSMLAIWSSAPNSFGEAKVSPSHQMLALGSRDL